jgi:hypothetical protein
LKYEGLKDAKENDSLEVMITVLFTQNFNMAARQIILSD